MQKAVEQFQLPNDWKRTQVIITDKDLTEIEVLRAKFPDARILLCQFHVLKWLRGVVRDDKKYDTYPSGILKQMDHCVSNMVYSKSEDEFDQHAAEFKYLACRDERISLRNYFDKNWVACKDMWVTVYRMNLPHFRNNTNNRLESSFGELKAGLDSSMSMRECLEATIRYQRRKEDEYATRVVMPGTRRNLTYEDEMNQLLGMTSEWLADVFEPEYKFAVEPESATIYSITDEDLYVNFTRDGHNYRVDKYNWMCICEFSSTMKLPCRHGMIYRKHVAHLLTIPYSSIPVRWLRVGSLEEEIASVDVQLRISSARVDEFRKKRMTERDKFKVAQSALSRLTTELSDLLDHKFAATLNDLENWRGRLRLGDTMMNTPGHSEESDEEMAPTQIASKATADAVEEKDETVHVDTVAEETNATEDIQTEMPKQKTVNMKPFKPRTRVGRPRKDRAADTAHRRQSRKEYNQGSKLRGALRGDDVVEVAEFIKSCEPPLSDLSSFLTTFEVRHLRSNLKQLSVIWRVPEPRVIPYRLPKAIVCEGLRLIDCKRPFGEAIDLCTPVDTTAECWVLTVDSIGDFTHQQLLAMQYIWSLIHASEKGMKCYSWLMSIADDQICYGETAAVAKRILNAWPNERIPGFGESVDIEWSHLYCARTNCWYNDNLITAFGKMIEGVHGNNTTIFLPSMKTPVPKTPKKGMRIPPTKLGLIAAASSGRIFLPLNINGSHWTCIVVDGSTHTVCCYDSMDKRTNHTLLAEVADEVVKKSLLLAFSIKPVHSPIQKDGYNCGCSSVCTSGAGSGREQAVITRRKDCYAADGIPCVPSWSSATKVKAKRSKLSRHSF